MTQSAAPVAEGEKILIVDDDARLRRLLERFFDEQGYRVRAVENVEQMDRLLARELFNLVVLDLMLPGEDGLSACRRLREAGNQMPIIMLTAKGDESSRIQGLELGIQRAGRAQRVEPAEGLVVAGQAQEIGRAHV